MKRLSLVLSIVAVVIAIAAVVLAILLPGSQGPMGPQGPTGARGATGAQGPEGPAWTPSVVQLEWTIAPNWNNDEIIYLDEGDILEGSVMGDRDGDEWGFMIIDLVTQDDRFYFPDYTIDFRYVAQSSGNHQIVVFNEQDVAADVILVYWIIKVGEGTSYSENYGLTTIVNPPGVGSVSPSSGEYESGDQVTLVAEPNSGYIFGYWSGGASGTTTTITITMDSDKSITVNFELVVPTGISWDEAKNHIGEWATESNPVYGLVAGASYRPDISGQPTWLNIGEDYPSQNRFVVIIWGENRGNFPQAPESYYLGKTIYVTGLIEYYDGVAEIQVTSPDQIDE